MARELRNVRLLVALEVTASLALEVDSLPAERLLDFALGYLGRAEGAAAGVEAVASSRDDAVEPAAVARLYFVAGGLRVAEGEESVAVERFRSAVRLDPELVVAHTRLGNALARLGRLEEAEAAFSAALRLDAGDPGLLLKRGTARLNLGRLDAARQDLERVLRQPGPQRPTAFVRVAQTWQREGELQRAEATLREALRQPFEPVAAVPVRLALGDLLAGGGRWTEASEQFHRAALAVPGDPRVVGRHVAALLQLGRRDEAFERLDDMLLRQRTDPEAWRVAALLYLRDRRGREALQLLQDGLTLHPGDPALGDLLERAGRQLPRGAAGPTSSR